MSRPGLVQNWPPPSVIEVMRPLANSSSRASRTPDVTEQPDRRCPSRRTQGWGLWPSAGEVIQRSSAGERSGEANCPNRWPRDEGLADNLNSGPGAERTDPAGVAVPNRIDQKVRGEAGSRRMQRMRFHHNGTPGCERRRDVAAEDAEGEWKVARAQHPHRPDRALHAPDVGPGRRLVRAREIDDGFQIIAALEQPRKRLALLRCPCELSAESHVAQRRLIIRSCDQLVGGRLDPLRNRVEEFGQLTRGG